MTPNASIERPVPAVVLLVHGTFARGADWIQTDSPLATTVNRALGGCVLEVPFEWSGRNSHSARLDAGTELAESIRSLSRLHPTASLHLVAHSHGGNVAAYAFREPGVTNAVTSIVCLGTPFIVAHRRDLAPLFRLLKFVGIGGVVLAALFATFTGLLVGTLVVFIPEAATVLFGLSLLSLVGVLSVAAIRLLLRLHRWLAIEVAPRLGQKQDSVLTSLQATIEQVPLLNIQVRHDEAAAYLRLVDWISALPFQIWSPALVQWSAVSVTSIFLVAGAVVAVRSDDWRQSWGEALLGLFFLYAAYLAALILVLGIITLVALALCALWPKVFRAHALGFGENGFMKNWLVHIAASRQPARAIQADAEILDLAGSGLRHSLLYQDARAIGAIAKWSAARAGKHDELRT